MEKERSGRTSSQNQFSIYSNKGGIVIKEELPSEKAFTKIVKEKDIAIDIEKAKIERNMSLNFDHSVVDGVIAIEMACAPKQSNLSGPVSRNIGSDHKIVKEKKNLDQVADDFKPAITTPLQENQIVAGNLASSKPEEELPLIDGTNNISSTGTGEINQDGFIKIQNPSEESNGSPGMSPNKDKTTTIVQNNNEEDSPPKRSFVNTGSPNDLGLYGPNISSVPSTPSSPVPNSGSVSRSDSTSTSARSFAFPIIQREWNASPAKLPKSDKGKSRGCFCCKF